MAPWAVRVSPRPRRPFSRATPGANFEDGFTLLQWTVIPRQGVLSDDTGERHIEPKVMEVLVYLAGRAGEVVTREELLDNVWSKMVVGDEALSRAVSLLRQHLQDDSRQFIQTVPRRGYRLIPSPKQFPRTTTDVTGTPVPVEAPSRRYWWRYLAGAAAVLVLGIVIRQATVSTATDPWLQAAQAGRPISVAVFPLSRQGQIPDDQAFVAESLADEIIVALSNIEGVRVVKRSASRTAGELAEGLDVDAIIEGSVRWQLDRALITLHLASARDGYQIWSQSFEADLKDVFYVQEAISSAVVAELERSLGRKLRHRGPIRSSHIPDPEAYELFLRGRVLFQQRGETAIRKSIERFGEAIAVDPNFARAHLAFAQACVILPSESDEPETTMFGRAEAALAKAQVLDPALGAEVRGTRGYIATRQLRWIDAHEDFQYALEHAPENATIHYWFSQFLSRAGHNARALEHAKIARELDTLSPAINTRLAVAYMWVNDQHAAARHWAIGDELGFRGNEALRGFWLAKVLWLVRAGDAGGAKEALAHHQEQLGLPVGPVLPIIDAFLNPQLRDQAAIAARRAVEGKAIAIRLQWYMWVILREMDAAYAAFYALEATPDEIALEFLFARETDRFRADPRFEQLAEHIGLTAYWDVYGDPDL